MRRSPCDDFDENIHSLMTDTPVQFSVPALGDPMSGLLTQRNEILRLNPRRRKAAVRFDDALSYLGRARIKLYIWWASAINPFALLGKELTVHYALRQCPRSAHEISIDSRITFGNQARDWRSPNDQPTSITRPA